MEQESEAWGIVKTAQYESDMRSILMRILIGEIVLANVNTQRSRKRGRRMRAIDADSLIRLIKIRNAWHTGYSIEEVVADIEQAPTLTDAERTPVTGEWNIIEKPRLGNPYRHYKCSQCGNCVPYRVRFCDSCGSKNC